MGEREGAAEEMRGGWATPTVQFRCRNCRSLRKKKERPFSSLLIDVFFPPFFDLFLVELRMTVLAFGRGAWVGPEVAKSAATPTRFCPELKQDISSCVPFRVCGSHSNAEGGNATVAN